MPLTILHHIGVCTCMGWAHTCTYIGSTAPPLATLTPSKCVLVVYNQCMLCCSFGDMLSCNLQLSLSNHCHLATVRCWGNAWSVCQSNVQSPHSTKWSSMEWCTCVKCKWMCSSPCCLWSPSRSTPFNLVCTVMQISMIAMFLYLRSTQWWDIFSSGHLCPDHATVEDTCHQVHEPSSSAAVTVTQRLPPGQCHSGAPTMGMYSVHLFTCYISASYLTICHTHMET